MALQLPSPVFRRKQKNYRIDFQTTQEHAEDQDPFSDFRDVQKVFDRTHHAQAGPDIADRRRHGCNC